MTSRDFPCQSCDVRVNDLTTPSLGGSKEALEDTSELCEEHLVLVIQARLSHQLVVWSHKYTQES